jgi:hypothetical protein
MRTCALVQITFVQLGSQTRQADLSAGSQIYELLLAVWSQPKAFARKKIDRIEKCFASC